MKNISQKKQKERKELDKKIDMLWDTILDRQEKILFHCLDCGTRFYSTEIEALQNGEYCQKCR